MKRLIPVVMMASLAVVGCNNKKSTPAPAAAAPPELTPPPAPAPAPEPVLTPAPQPAAVATPAPDSKSTAKAVPAKTSEAKAVPAKASGASSSAKAYLVKKGDTLSEIASAHKTTVKKIMALNPEIKDADAIYVGQKLKMP